MTIIKIKDINGVERECDSVKPDLNFPGYLKVEYLSKKHPETRISDWYPITDFKRLNPEYAYLASNDGPPAENTMGVVSLSTETTLKDKEKSWKVNVYQGFNVWISRGIGEGQVRKVVKNTKTTLTVDVPWEVVPNKASQYVISQDTYYPPANNNSLPYIEEPKKEEPIKVKVIKEEHAE